MHISDIKKAMAVTDKILVADRTERDNVVISSEAEIDLCYQRIVSIRALFLFAKC